MTDTLQVCRLHVTVDIPRVAFLMVGGEERTGLRARYHSRIYSSKSVIILFLWVDTLFVICRINQILWVHLQALGYIGKQFKGWLTAIASVEFTIVKHLLSFSASHVCLIPFSISTLFMPLVKPSTMLYYICKYSKFSCIKNTKRGENSLIFKYCVGRLVSCHLSLCTDVKHLSQICKRCLEGYKHLL